MQYTKAMVDLIQEARRRAPSEDKPNIKLANPDVLFELLKLYQKSSDTIFKVLVKEAFHLAGDPWPARLEDKRKAEQMEEEVPEGYVVKVYRGQTVLERKANSPDNKRKSESTRPKRMYRGQVVG
ncbi:MAG: hypothetical protein RLN82_07305 [Pseudomonadales bacterium]